MHKECRQCHLKFENDRINFHRCTKNGKECLVDVCKSCVSKNRNAKEWDNGKLLCHICGNYFERNCFNINSGSKSRDGLDRRCTKCKSKLSNINKNRLTGDDKLRHILISRLGGIKQRCRKKGWNANITLDYLFKLYKKQNGRCALSNIQMTYDILNGRTPTNISIDRIDSNKEYTEDNIQLVCIAINTMKSDLDMEQLLYFCKSIINNNKIV